VTDVADPRIEAIMRRGEMYGRVEILLQCGDRELTPAEAALLRAGIYCGIAAAFEERGWSAEDVESDGQ
jgi:hypothetical protein